MSPWYGVLRTSTIRVGLLPRSGEGIPPPGAVVIDMTEATNNVPPEVTRLQSKVCEHCQPLRHETNILVLARLNLLYRLTEVNLRLALASIMYFATSLVLLAVVAWPQQHLVDGDVFHYLDFGCTFLFSLIEVLTLVYSPERRFSSPTLLRFLMFFSVCSTSVAFLFICLNRSAFEVIAHNIDYANDFTIAMVDLLLVSTVIRSPASHPGRDLATQGRLCGPLGKQIAVGATYVPLGMSFLQVSVYNCFGLNLRGHLLGERPAHVLEFVFDLVGAAINFWFCLDSKMLAEELTRQIMLAPDEVVVVIDPESTRSVHAADECGRSPYTHPRDPGVPYTHAAKPLPWHNHSHYSHAEEDMWGCANDHCCEHDHSIPLAVPTQQNASMLTEFLLPPSTKA